MIPKTEGFVLKTFDYRETSKIARFFTKDYGKISGVLKGIRKDPRKFGSNLDQFSLNDIVYYRYSRSDLHLISHCDLKEYYFPIRKDYNRNMAAHYALELTDTIIPPEEPNQKIYTLLINYFRSLQDIVDIEKLVFILQIKMLLYSGFRPHLDSCVKTDKKISGRAYFSTAAGGLVSPQAQMNESQVTAVSHGTISSMLHIEKNQWGHCLRLGLTKQVRKELKYILNNFLLYHLEKRIRSAKYL